MGAIGAMKWKHMCILALCFGVLQACVVTDENPSWSLVQRGSPRPSRFKREAPFDDSNTRNSCDPEHGETLTRVDTSERVSNLINLLVKNNVHAYIVTPSDEHLSEYVAPSDKRREYISGFTGSAGTAIILSDGRRALWTDGRYFLQADQQLDCNWILMRSGNEGVPTLTEWLKDSLKAASSVGVDPKLVSAMEWIDLEKELQESSITLTPIASNLVDEIWTDKGGEMNESPIEVLELQFAGKKWEDKIAEVREEMKENNAEMVVFTALDEIAWLFNLRGSDIPNNPVFKSYAIIDPLAVRLFVDKKIDAKLDLHLHVNQCTQECVEIHKYRDIQNTVQAMASMDTVKKVILPSKYSYSGGASYAIYSAVPEEKRLQIVSPALLPKSRKNNVERQGMRRAHVKDAVALIDFLSFLEDEINAGNEWNEISAATRLEEFRSEQEHFRSLSFNTISAFGSNGAIIHYTPQPTTNKIITKDAPYLLDSGGQYKDGTTDVTRTLHYGTPTEFQKDAYTRVLKGALDVASLVFPKKTKDTRVDVLARKSLFEVGLDYKHGTGHGIGMFLFIHEAPTQMRIYGKEEHDLEEGQFFSDEPGYYKEGEFGIRLETILTVERRSTKYSENEMLGFEPVTLVPFEPKFINLGLLDRKQCEYLNWYHEMVRQVVGPELEKQRRTRAQAYMMDRTESLDCSTSGMDDATGDLYREQVVQVKKAGLQEAGANGVAKQTTGTGLITLFSVIIFLGIR